MIYQKLVLILIPLQSNEDYKTNNNVLLVYEKYLYNITRK